MNIATIIITAALAASAVSRLLLGGSIERPVIHDRQEQPAVVEVTPVIPAPILPDVPVIVCAPFVDKQCFDDMRIGID